jgi:hypothetical protein
MAYARNQQILIESDNFFFALRFFLFPSVSLIKEGDSHHLRFFSFMWHPFLIIVVDIYG